MILASDKVDAIKCLRHQVMNIETATIGQMQRRNLFLMNIYKRAQVEKGRDIRSFMTVN